MTKSDNNVPNTNMPNDEIDIISIVKNLWDGRRTIIRVTLVAASIGLFIALVSPKEYTSTTIMVPQTNNSAQSQMGGLSSIAAMAGVNLNNMEGSETLSPMVYPQIIQSVSFQLDLMNALYTVEGVDQPVSLFTYYNEIKRASISGQVKKYTIGLPRLILRSLRTAPSAKPAAVDSYIALTFEQEEVCKKLVENISLEVNEKEGYFTLSASFGDALLAAQVAQKAQLMLQAYITEFKIEKAQSKLKFVEERYAEKQAEFELVQEKLASYRDRNKNVSSQLARTGEERLQSEYNLVYSVWTELAKQLEQAKIQVKEETPVFSILQPVQVPNQKSKPNRPVILIIWTFLGVIIGTGLVFGGQYFDIIKKRWAEPEKES